jgi:hypothetical protein
MRKRSSITRFKVTVSSVGVLQGVLKKLSEDFGTVYMPNAVDYNKPFSFEVGGEKTLNLCKAMLGRRIRRVYLIE